MFGIRLFLSELGILWDEMHSIVVQCKRYIDYLSSYNKLTDLYVGKLAIFGC